MLSDKLYHNKLRLRSATLHGYDCGQYCCPEGDMYPYSVHRASYPTPRCYCRRYNYETGEELYTRDLRRKLYSAVDANVEPLYPTYSTIPYGYLTSLKHRRIGKEGDLVQECRAARFSASELREKLRIKQMASSPSIEPRGLLSTENGSGSSGEVKVPELKLYRGLPHSAMEEVVSEGKEGVTKPRSAFSRAQRKKDSIQRRIEMLKLMDSNGEILHSLLDPKTADYSLYSF